MSVQLRVRLPALEHLRADSTVEWAQMHKGGVLAHGREGLAVLGQRHPQAEVLACLDPHDLIRAVGKPLTDLGLRRTDNRTRYHTHRGARDQCSSGHASWQSIEGNLHHVVVRQRLAAGVRAGAARDDGA